MMSDTCQTFGPASAVYATRYPDYREPTRFAS
jgi:hypothetical protein